MRSKLTEMFFTKMWQSPFFLEVEDPLGLTFPYF